MPTPLTALETLPRPVAYVLGGGASLGAVQVGMLQALEEHGLRPDLVVGTSVGALNGALLSVGVDGAADRLRTVWEPMRRQDVFPGTLLSAVWRLQRSRTHLLGALGLELLIQRELQASTFDALAVPFAAVTVDLEEGHVAVISRGPLVPALLASAAIPGVFDAVDVSGRMLLDGGVLANVPVAQAVELGAASVVVLDCTVPAPEPDRAGVGDVLGQVTRIQQRTQLEAMIGSAARHLPVVVLPPPGPRRVNPFDFSHTSALISEAYEAGRDQLAGLRVDGPGVYGDPYTRYLTAH